MNFQDFYQPGRPRYSFETFPPKDEKGVSNLFEALKDLKSFDPAFISVTYGALGSTRDLTRDLAIRIQKEVGLTTAFHFTCVGATRASIRDYVSHLKNEGLNLVVALRGDPPSGSTEFVKIEDGFSYANELVAYLKSLQFSEGEAPAALPMEGATRAPINTFSIAVAGYPEGHIEASDKKTDLENLARKVAAGADIVITQLFYDNADYFDFVDRARKIGIQVPITPGIMPILSLKQIEKITRMCGAKIPETLRQELVRHESNSEKIREIGIQHAIKQCRELLEKGVPGIHFYILNKSYSTRRILEGLR